MNSNESNSSSLKHKYDCMDLLTSPSDDSKTERNTLYNRYLSNYVSQTSTSNSSAAGDDNNFDLDTTTRDEFQTNLNPSYNQNSSDGNVQPSTSNSNEPDINDIAEHIILSLLWDKGKLAAAYYNLETCQISVLPDTFDCSLNFRITKGLYQQIKPQKVITINKNSDKFLKELLALIKNNENYGPSSQGSKPSSLQLFSRKAHSYETCKKKVLNIQLGTEPKNATVEERHRYLQTVLDFSYEIMIHSLGVLLMYLDRFWGMLEETAQIETPKFNCINKISLNNFLLMDDDTYKALQIINDQEYSFRFTKGIGGFDKQSPSLFGLYKNCRTLSGARKMRDFFIHPTNDRKVINARHQVISFFLDANNDDIKKGIYESLRHVTNINPILKKMVGLTATSKHWKIFNQTVVSCVQIGDLLRRYVKKAPLFQEIVAMHSQLIAVSSCVFELIDTSNENCVGIKIGIDLELDAKKQAFAQVEKIINLTGQHEFQKLPDFIQECKIYYVHEVGYLLEVRKWKKELTVQDINSLGFKLLFCTSSHVAYKSPLCVELDRKFGVIFTEIMSHEVRVIVRLVQFLEKYFAKIQYCLNLIAELDCLLSMAHVAFELDLTCPVITKENIIEIKDGRHPLIEIISNKYVPNDYISKHGEGNVKIITGPNASGKSVFMKQVALICFMVHIGSFVPAASVKMCLLDNIFSCIKALESVSNGISNFLIDLRQMAYSMNSSNGKTLLLIDEFGNGTTEVDGAALLAASLKAFLDQKEQCPHILVSTHFNQLSTILPSNPKFQYLKTELTFDTGNNVIYLYKIVGGQNSDNYAVKVAENEGLDREIIERMKIIKLALEGNASFPPCDSTSHLKINVPITGYLNHLISSENISKVDLKQIAIHLKKDND